MKSSIDLLRHASRVGADIDQLDFDLTQIICDVRSACRSEYGLVSYFDPVTNELYYKRICGTKKTHSESGSELFTRYSVDQGVLGWCARHHRTVNLSAEENTSLLPGIEDEELGIRIRSILATPMNVRDKLYGVIAVINKRNAERFTAYDQKLLEVMASVLALTIENARLNEEMLNMNRLSDLGKNIAGSAHGMRNILNNLDGGAFIVETGVAQKRMNKVVEGWDIMKRNSNRLRDIVLDMLLVARPSKPSYKPGDINRLCLDLIEMIKENALQEKVEIRADLDPKIKPCCMDEKGIYRCVLNLISNGIEACQNREGGIVTVQTRLPQPDLIQVAVTDNGSGISDENLSHIFEVFFTTKGSKGTGLGLPVTKKIIEEHRGKIDVLSNLNTGSTFTITLPRIHTENC